MTSSNTPMSISGAAQTALATDDYRMMTDLRQRARHSGNENMWKVVSTLTSRFKTLPPMDAAPNGQMSCKPVDADKLQAAITRWADGLIQSTDETKPHRFNEVLSVIADKDAHPKWLDRAIVMLAENQFGNPAEDKKFAVANKGAAVDHVSVKHPQFDNLVANYAQYVFTLYPANERPQAQGQMILEARKLDDDAKKLRIAQIACEMALRPGKRPTPLGPIVPRA